MSNNPNSKESISKFDNWTTRIIILAIIITLYGACWYGVTHYIELDSNNGWSIRGQFGDMFGAVNALFSGLAFAGIIYTIFLQREELRAQREELKLNREELALTRKEISGQRKEFEKQNTTLKRQRFETTFFNMLSMHFKVLESISIDERQGIKAIEKHANAFLNYSLKYRKPPPKGDPIEDSKSDFIVHFFKFEGTAEIQLSGYLYSLLNLHRAIKESKFKRKSEDRYLNLLKGYISTQEKSYLYYHIVCKFKPSLSDLDADLNIANEAIKNAVAYPLSSILEARIREMRTP